MQKTDEFLETGSQRPLFRQVKDRITQLINDGVMKVGDQLPSERALSAQLGVSRHSLRQAMAALEAQGLIEIRHGSGAYLMHHEPSQAASDLADALISTSEKLPYVMEARFAIEPFLTGLAAERGSAAEIRAIRAALNMMEKEIEEGGSGEKGDIAFHTAIVVAAHNPILADVMARLQPDTKRLREEALAQPANTMRAISAHYDILEAIEARDRERAVKASHQHLVDAAEALLVSDLGTPSSTFLAEILVDATNDQFDQDAETAKPDVRTATAAAFAASLSAYPLTETAQTVKEKTGLDTVHNLNTTANAFGCSPKATAAVVAASSDLSAYPDPAASQLRSTLARKHGVTEEQLIFGNGSDELLLLAARTFLAPGRAAAACEPVFSPYRAHTLSTGANYLPVGLRNGKTDDIALAAMTSKASLLWVNNPHNPTGTYLNETELKDLLTSVPKNVIVVLDETHADYATSADFPESIELLGQFPNLIVTRTFSGIHGLGGLRIGYAVANEKVAELMNAVRDPFNTSSIAQAAAQAATLDTDFVLQSRERNARNRDAIEDFCLKYGLDYFPSQTNFVLLEAPGGADNSYEALKERGYLVRSGTDIGFPTKIRLTIGTEDQVTGVLAAIKDLL